MSVGLAAQVVTQLPDCACAAAGLDDDANAWLAALDLASPGSDPMARPTNTALNNKE
jgi:hypothetical protein